ncbi:MAG: dihydrolipoyl dehydrogenase [Myxococcales bacterium]|nr:dihydrolipoyl dehydrogenase [Myxococcales bacterium]
MAYDYDVIVIGSGPGGYVAAIRAAQLGLSTCIIEKDPTLGGTCLNVGCIPSKALLESSELYAVAQHEMAEHGVNASSVSLDLERMMQRKRGIVSDLTGGVKLLMKKNKIAVKHGLGRLLAEAPAGEGGGGGGGGKVEVAGETIAARHVILANGSEPIELPFLPFDGERVVSSTGALAFEAVPEHLVVVGAGVIGLELGSVWARLGAKVSVVELLPEILPNSDKQMSKLLLRTLKKQGLEFLLGCKVKGAEVQGEGVVVRYEDGDGAEQTLACDRVMVCVGRRPRSEGLAEAGVALDDKRRVAIDDHFRTNREGVYAIGDLVRGPMLAHKAEDEGVAVAELIAGQPGHVNYEAIPNVIYTHPELAEVGLSEEAAKARGFEVRTGKYSFKPNARAKTLVGAEDGMVKLVACAKTDRLLGAHIVGPRASDMIAELVMAFEFSASAEDVARTVHAHPTLSEIVKEAALAVDKRPIHG